MTFKAYLNFKLFELSAICTYDVYYKISEHSNTDHSAHYHTYN